ncbi:MAG: hypothetical protein AB7U97_14340 [Pirellulales bacterium]
MERCELLSDADKQLVQFQTTQAFAEANLGIATVDDNHSHRVILPLGRIKRHQIQ